MTILSRLFLLATFILAVGCASDHEYTEHQTRVPMLPSGARVLVNKQGVKMFEYQGVLYQQRIDGNGWVVVPSETSGMSTTTTTTKVSGDGKTVVR